MPPRARGGPGHGRGSAVAGARGGKAPAKAGGSVPSYMRGTAATSAAQADVKHEYKVGSSRPTLVGRSSGIYVSNTQTESLHCNHCVCKTQVDFKG